MQFIKKYSVGFWLLITAMNAMAVDQDIYQGIKAKRPIIHKEFPLIVSKTSPTSNEEVTVTLNVLGAKQMIVSFSGAGCGNFRNILVQNSKLSETQSVGIEGFCSIKVIAKTNTVEQKYATMFSVIKTKAPEPILKVENASYIPNESLPSSSEDKTSPVITNIHTPLKLIKDQNATFIISIKDKNKLSEIQSSLISIKDIDGYFEIPVQINDGKIVFDINIGQADLDMQATINGQNQLNKVGTILGFSIQLKDKSGHISNTVHQLIPLENNQ